VTRRLAVLLILVSGLGLTACGGNYALRGKVVAGGYGNVIFLEPGDANFEAEGLAGARVSVYRDPHKPNRARVARGRSGPGGEIDLPIGAFGAGFLEEEWLIEVIRPGFSTLETLVTLPAAGDDRLALIMLMPGASTAPGTETSEDLWEQVERYR
jgi:hypothetical protein